MSILPKDIWVMISSDFSNLWLDFKCNTTDNFCFLRILLSLKQMPQILATWFHMYYVHCKIYTMEGLLKHKVNVFMTILWEHTCNNYCTYYEGEKNLALILWSLRWHNSQRVKRSDYKVKNFADLYESRSIIYLPTVLKNCDLMLRGEGQGRQYL